MNRLLALVVMLPVMSFAAAEQGDNGKNEQAKEAPEAKVFVTGHEARVGGKKIEYTVTAGTITVKGITS